MSRWGSGRPRRGGRPRDEGRAGRGAGYGGTPAAPLVEDIDGVLLVRSVEDDSFPMAALAEVAHTFAAEADIVTVLVGSGGGGQGDVKGGGHWPRLAALLDSLHARGIRRVRLVLSGAGDERPGRPCAARRIADGWGFEVFAPDGVVLITPGGTLFVSGGAPSNGARSDGAWWRFAPGEAARKLGPRAPAPGWQEAMDRVPARTSGGCVVEQIPAGVLIRPADARGPRPEDLGYAVPLDPEHAMVLVGAPRAEDVAAGEVAAVLAALPSAHRAGVRLAPGGLADPLRLAHAVADMLDSRVEVLTGLPLLPDHAAPGAVPRPTLIGHDGEPSWQPYVTSVACLPKDAQGRLPEPRLLGCHPPDWLPVGAEPGTVRLTDGWQARVTRSGLALWAQGSPRPPLAGHTVDSESCLIELGSQEARLDASMLTALSRLLTGLGAAGRARTTLLVRGRLISGEGELRRLAAEHCVRGIRYVTVGRPALPVPAGPVPASPAPRRAGQDSRSLPAGAVRPDRPAEQRPAVGGLAGMGPAPSPRTGPLRRPGGVPAFTSAVARSAGGGAAATPVRTPAAATDVAASSSFTLLPGHASSEAERAAFREMVGDGWDRHADAVAGLLARMPVPPPGDEGEAARVDLAAAHAYLTAGEGALYHCELVRGLRSGDGRSLAYAACLASALRGLPSYRGVALRGGAADGAEPEVGALLQDPAPIGALVKATAWPRGAAVRYAIWSTTGRETGDVAGADGEIVFAPGTSFRVLGTWTNPESTPVVLLRELPAHATAYMDATGELSPRDRTLLAQLKDALVGVATAGSGASRSWPERCVGPVGGSG